MARATAYGSVLRGMIVLQLLITRMLTGFEAYFVAWIFNFTIPLLFCTLIALVGYPPSRPILFPPAPLALVNSKTGGIQSPSAGVLGSHDSATGAPENHKGEAVEKEASNFVNSFAQIALASASGKKDHGNPETDPLDASVPDPTNIAIAGPDAKDNAGGGKNTTKHDKTKQPMEDAMWTKMRPAMHVVGDVADGWERFAKYEILFIEPILLLTLSQCPIADRSISERHSTHEARRSPDSSPCDQYLYKLGHVYEDEYFLRRVWFLRRSCRLACFELA